MTALRLAGVLVVGTAAITACGTGIGGEQPCTQVGCSSGFYVDVAADLEEEVAYDVRACVDGGCVSFTTGEPSRARDAGIEWVGVDAVGDRVTIDLEGRDWEGEHHLTLRVSEDDVAVVDIDRRVRMEPRYANGERCGVTCHTAHVDG